MKINVIEKIMEKTGKSKEELTKELDEIYSKLDSKIPEDIRKTYAVNRLVALYRKELASPSEQFEVVVFGATDAIDMVARRRRDAIEKYKANPKDAIAKGIVNENGAPLHYATSKEAESLPDWAFKQRFVEEVNGPIIRKGKNYIGKPLPDSDYQRVAFGVCKKPDEPEWKEMLFRIRGENCDVYLPLFTYTKIPVFKTRASTEVLTRLNDSGKLSVKVIKELTGEEVEAFIETVFKDKVVTISQFVEWCQQHQEFTRLAIMKVIVTEMIPTPTSTGSQMIRVQDDTMDFLDDEGNVIQAITCFVPSHVPINFPERAEIWLVGQPTITDRGKSINVLGIYVPEIFKNVVPTTKNIESEEDEEGVEKW